MSLEFRDMGWRNNTALKIHQCEGSNNLGSGCGWRKEVQEMSPDILTYRGGKTEDKQQRSMTRTSEQVEGEPREGTSREPREESKVTHCHMLLTGRPRWKLRADHCP